MCLCWPLWLLTHLAGDLVGCRQSFSHNATERAGLLYYSICQSQYCLTATVTPDSTNTLFSLYVIVRIPQCQVFVFRVTDAELYPRQVFFDIRAKQLPDRMAPGRFDAFKEEMRSMCAPLYPGLPMRMRIELFDPSLLCDTAPIAKL